MNEEKDLVLEKEEIDETESNSELSNEELALKAELDKANEEIAKLKDAYLRAGADYENYKKRLEKDKLNAVLFAQEGLLKDLLPVLDALDNASNFESDDEFSKQLKQGLGNTINLFCNVLKKHGISEIKTEVGDDFNHDLHECMMNIECDLEPNKVAQVFSKGYVLNDRVIRASKVSVSK